MSLRTWALAGAAACAIAVAGPIANAANYQLGFILDRSGSIGSGNWNTIRNGLANAVNALIPTSGEDVYYLSVVTFASTATVNIANVEVTAASKAGIVNTIQNLPFSGGLTNYNAAFTSMGTALQAGANNINTLNFFDASYVNFATDGDPTTGGTGVAQRNALVTLGVDNISIEGIGGSVDANNLRNNFCYPQPCDSTLPFNFPTQGFYTAVASIDQWEAAIDNKIRVITGQPVPEPATLALLGAGLLGLAALRRRKAA